MRKLLAIALLALLSPLALAPTAAQADPCGAVKLSPGHRWIVGAEGISCRRARHWTRSMLRGDGRPGGHWRCKKSGRGRLRSGGCSKGPHGTAPLFLFYPLT